MNLTVFLKRSTDGSRLPGRTVTFKVNGVAIGNVVTDVNGMASFPYLLNLVAGNHKVTTSFAGDAYDNPSTGGATIVVTP